MTCTEAKAQTVELALRGEELMHWPVRGAPPHYRAQTLCVATCGVEVSTKQIPRWVSWVTCPLCRLAAGLPEIST